MHANGGRGLVPAAVLPAAGESRRAGDSAALVRRRSCAGGTGLIAGGRGESSRTDSVMDPSGLKHVPQKACPGLDPGWVPVLRKRTCANKEREQDDDSKKSHPALAKRLEAEVIDDPVRT